MIKISIPKHVRKGFEYYLNLSKEDKSNLIEILNSIPVNTELNEVIEDFKKKQVEIENIDDILYIAISFIGINDERESDLKEYAAAFNKSLELANISGLEINSDTEEEILNLLTVMNSGNFSISKKSKDLELDRTNIIEESKIITDIRPVFGGKDDEEIVNSIITYNLRFSYREDSYSENQKKIYFTLDASDLAEIKEQILRAEKKAKRIVETYEKTSFN